MTVETMNPEVETRTDEEKAGLSIGERARHALKEVQEETEKRMKDLMDRGEVYGKESLQSIKDAIAPAVRLSEKVLNKAKSNAEWMQDKVEEAVNRALGSLHIPTAAEMLEMKARSEGFEKKAEALSKIEDVLPAVEESIEGMKELRGEVAELRKSVEKLGRGLEMLDRKLRKLNQASVKRPVKSTKTATKSGTKSEAGK